MTHSRSPKRIAAVTLVGSVALILSLISSTSHMVEAAPNVPHKPDLSHPKGTSPWPKSNETPDTDTPEVKAWVKSVDWSKVPKLPIRKTSSPGDPPECPKQNTPKSDCWWTCSGCFAPDDVVDCPGRNAWGLTFDDGPKPSTTENLLTLLKEKNATATFFVTGTNSAKAPWLLQETLDYGHHLASHTWSHSGLTTLTNEQIVAELKWTEKYIFDHTGYKVKYYRPPYGDVDNRVRAIARQLGFLTVIWSSEWDTQDWQLEENTISSNQIVGIFKNDLKGLPKRNKGVITLEHDGDPKMTTMARTLLDMGLKKGMKPMSIAQCLGDKVGYNAVPLKAKVEAIKPLVPEPADPKKDEDKSTKDEPEANTKIPAPPKDDDSLPGSFSANSVDKSKMASAAIRSPSAVFSVTCWTLAAVAVSFAF